MYQNPACTGHSFGLDDSLRLDAKQCVTVNALAIEVGLRHDEVSRKGSNVPKNISAPLLCARCAAELQPGSGDFYRVLIEAVADPSPPVILTEETAGEIRRQIDELLEEMQNISAQEAMDRVYRRLVLYLCGKCYREWIENPTG